MFKNLGQKFAENIEGTRSKVATAALIVVAIVIAAAMVNKLNTENEVLVIEENRPEDEN